MPPKESLYPADWLKIAEKDLVRVHQYIPMKINTLPKNHMVTTLKMII